MPEQSSAPPMARASLTPTPALPVRTHDRLQSVWPSHARYGSRCLITVVNHWSLPRCSKTKFRTLKQFHNPHFQPPVLMLPRAHSPGSSCRPAARTSLMPSSRSQAEATPAEKGPADERGFRDIDAEFYQTKAVSQWPERRSYQLPTAPVTTRRYLHTVTISFEPRFSRQKKARARSLFVLPLCDRNS